MRSAQFTLTNLRGQDAGGALEQVQEPIAVRLHDDLTRRPIDGEFGLDQLVDPIIIKRVVRRHLVPPDYFARAGLNGQDRVGVQVIALAAERIPGRGIAGPQKTRSSAGS